MKTPISEVTDRPRPRSARWVSALLAVLLGFVPQACGDDTGTPPLDTIRFGQVGEVKVGVVAPLVFGEGVGELQQILTWGSSGDWVLREIISYRGLIGDETVTKNEGDPLAYSSVYASLITQLNETDGVEIISIPPILPEPCEAGQTRVTVTIWDEIRKEEESWVRCVANARTLATLQTSEAGPDLEAGRVIQAAILVRDFTQGPDFVSSYVGSVPFGTLDRGEDSEARLPMPMKFLAVPEGNPSTPAGWVTFWLNHNGTLASRIPEVDWLTEMVIIATVGIRTEAGDSVEVRRVVQTGEDTQVYLYERIPGDFCSPASRDHYPYHIVVAPRTLLDIRFSAVETERVPCGE